MAGSKALITTLYLSGIPLLPQTELKTSLSLLSDNKPATVAKEKPILKSSLKNIHKSPPTV